MALDDLVKLVGSETQLTNQLRENATYNQYISTVQAAEAMGENPEYLQALEKNPGIQEALIAQDTAQALQKRIVEETRENKEKIISSLDEASLTELAMQYSKDAKPIQTGVQALREGNSRYFLDRLMKNSSPYMGQVLSRMNSDQVLQIAQKDLYAQQRGFIKENLYSEKLDNKKKPTGKYEFDKVKAIQYVGNLIGDKPQDYMGLARTYATTKAK